MLHDFFRSHALQWMPHSAPHSYISDYYWCVWTHFIDVGLLYEHTEGRILASDLPTMYSMHCRFHRHLVSHRYERVWEIEMKDGVKENIVVEIKKPQKIATLVLIMDNSQLQTLWDI